MAVMYYWSGTEWLPIASGGGGDGTGTGPQGPPGADGKSVEVFGPQVTTPTPTRKGDVWLQELAFASVKELDVAAAASPVVVGLVDAPAIQPKPLSPQPATVNVQPQASVSPSLFFIDDGTSSN